MDKHNFVMVSAETCISDRLKEEIESMVQYLLMKVGKRDWHAVADAAMDLREIEAKLSVLKGK